MPCERLTEQDWQGSDRGLIELLSWHFAGGTEENHEEPDPGKLVSD
jgi:hypothetical protein